MEWLAGFVFLLLGLVLAPVVEPWIRRLLRRLKHRSMDVTPQPFVIAQHDGPRNTAHLFPPVGLWRNACGTVFVTAGAPEITPGVVVTGTSEGGSGLWD